MPTHWKENDVVVNGAKLHYTRTGDGSKPALVLAHGFSDNGMCWLPTAQALESDYDVILPDARGHGKSARMQPGESLDAAADLAGLINALELQSPVVGGHSMGANTTSLLGVRYPSLAKAIILEDPPWRLPEPPKEADAEEQKAPPPRFHDWLSDLKEKSLDEIIATGKQDNPGWADIEWPAWAESKLQFDMGFLQAMRVPGSDWTDNVKNITCPVLLVTADPEKGAIVTPESAQAAAASNPHIQVVNISNAGHNIRRENFKDFLQAVKAFLAGLDG